MNTLSEYTYFYIHKNITSYTFLLIFKIVERLQSILNTKQNTVKERIHLLLFIKCIKKKLLKGKLNLYMTKNE